MMDLRKRAGGEHLYIRGVVDNDDYKIIFLQSDQQAQLSGRLRYVMADTTFGVVAPGAEKAVCHRLPLRPVPRRRLTGITSLSCTLLFPAAYVLIAVTAWWLR